MPPFHTFDSRSTIQHLSHPDHPSVINAFALEFPARIPYLALQFHDLASRDTGPHSILSIAISRSPDKGPTSAVPCPHPHSLCWPAAFTSCLSAWVRGAAFLDSTVVLERRIVERFWSVANHVSLFIQLYIFYLEQVPLPRR